MILTITRHIEKDKPLTYIGMAKPKTCLSSMMKNGFYGVSLSNISNVLKSTESCTILQLVGSLLKLNVVGHRFQLKFDYTVLSLDDESETECLTFIILDTILNVEVETIDLESLRRVKNMNDEYHSYETELNGYIQAS